MSKNSIKIYNPSDVPFGPLSNGYLYHMTIDDKNWPTVTNYIYSNMLQTHVYRIALQNVDIQNNPKQVDMEERISNAINSMEVRLNRRLDVHEKDNIKISMLQDHHLQGLELHAAFENYSALEKMNIVRSALHIAFYQRLFNNNFRRSLYETGTKNIVYESSFEDLFDIDPLFRNKNIVGKVLMNVRNIMLQYYKNQDLTAYNSKNDERLFLIYRAYMILLDGLNKGQDIKQFINQPIESIVTEFSEHMKSQCIEYLKSEHKNEEKYGGKKFMENYRKITGNDISTTYELIEKANNMTYEQIIESIHLPGSYRIAYYTRKERADIINYCKRGQFPIVMHEFNNPGTLVQELMKMNVNTLKQVNEAKKNAIIVNTYTRYILGHKYPAMSSANLDIECKKLYLAAPSIENYYGIRNKIKKLYVLGALPADLIGEIDREIMDLEQRAVDINSIPAEQKSDSSSSASTSDNDLSRVIKKALKEEKSNDKESKKEKIETVERSESLVRNGLSANNQIIDARGKIMEGLKLFTRNIIRRSTTEDLQKLLNQYESGEKDSEIGVWRITAGRTKKGIRPILYESRKKLKNVDIHSLIEKYNEGVEDNKKIPVYKRNQKVNYRQSIYVKGHTQEEKDAPNQLQPADIKEDTIVVTDDAKNPLSQYFSDEFSVGTLKYPSVVAYVFTRLMMFSGMEKEMEIKRVTIKEKIVSYERMMPEIRARQIVVETISSGENVENMYLTHLAKMETNFLKMYCLKGLNKKFQDDLFLGILNLTGDSEIIWNDPHDTILGIGRKNGQNMCGKMLMDIRNSIEEMIRDETARERQEREAEEKEDGKKRVRIGKKESLQKLMREKVHLVYLYKLVLSDPFLKSWIKMRLVDLCKTVFRFKEYMRDIVKIDQEIDPKFAKTVIGNVYSCCSTLPSDDDVKKLVAMSNPDIEKVIDEFKSIIMSSCPGMKTKVDNSHVETLRALMKEREDIDRLFWATDVAKVRIQKEIDKEKMIREQKKEFLEYIKGTIVDGITVPRTQDDINDFKFSQQIMLDMNFGDVRPEIFHKEEKAGRDNREVKNHEEVLAEIDRRIVQANVREKDELQLVVAGNNGVVLIYWVFLMTIVYTGFKIQYNHMRNKPGAGSLQSLRKMIIEAQEYNNKKHECTDKTMSDCVLSAIFNILKAIDVFKYNYCDSQPLSKHDVNLAVSIILNKNIKLGSAEVKGDSDIQEIEEEKIEEKEQDFELNDLVSERSDENVDDYAGEDNDNEEREQFGLGKVTFGMNQPNLELESVKNVLRTLSSYTTLDRTERDIQKTARYVIKGVQFIKNSKENKHIKNNRIMFFAELK